MRHVVTAAARVGWCLLVASLVGASGLPAQGKRDSLITRAKDEFDAGRRIQLLIAALDPAYGPPAGGWGDGVQALAQALMDEGRAPAAATWLRWATRLSPQLEPDTVQYTPQVGDALKAAREFVNRSRSSGDSLVGTTWVWPAMGVDQPVGWIRVDSATTIPLEVTIEGSSPVGRGGRVQVTPGSYEVRGTAAGYDSVRVIREALPGATTVLRFRLHPVRPQVAAAQNPNPQSTRIPTVRKHKFPWALAALGAAGGVAAVVLLAGGKSSSGGGATGGITFFFPNP